MTKVYNSQIHMARAKWICNNCGREIKPGEQYACVLDDDSKPQKMFKYCSNCYEIKELNIINQKA